MTSYDGREYDQNSYVGQPIEGPSSTTSQTNAHSGSKLYLVPLILVILLICALFVAASRIKSFVGTIGLGNYSSSSEIQFPDINLEDPENINSLLENIYDMQDTDSPVMDTLQELQDTTSLDELIDMLTQLNDQEPSGTDEIPIISEPIGNQNFVSTDEALDYELSVYGSRISDGVLATTYAGAESNVSELVRSLVKADKNAAIELSRLVNTAARDKSQRQESLNEAANLAQQLQTDLKAFDLSLGGAIEDGEILETLANAQEAAILRWELLEQEVLMLQDESLSYTRLEKLDNDIVDATQDAAEFLSDALTESAQQQRESRH